MNSHLVMFGNVGLSQSCFYRSANKLFLISNVVSDVCVCIGGCRVSVLARLIRGMRGLDLLKALHDLAQSSCSLQAKYQVLITDVPAGSHSGQGSGTHPAPGLLW